MSSHKCAYCWTRKDNRRKLNRAVGALKDAQEIIDSLIENLSSPNSENGKSLMRASNRIEVTLRDICNK